MGKKASGDVMGCKVYKSFKTNWKMIAAFPAFRLSLTSPWRSVLLSQIPVDPLAGQWGEKWARGAPWREI